MRVETQIAVDALDVNLEGVWVLSTTCRIPVKHPTAGAPERIRPSTAGRQPRPACWVLGRYVTAGNPVSIRLLLHTQALNCHHTTTTT